MKVKQKISGVFRSELGSKNVLAVLEAISLRPEKNSAPILGAIKSALEGNLCSGIIVTGQRAE